MHMPASTCGSWPSFWSFGTEKTWPANGEIDIIEGIHDSTRNAMSLHTSEGCTITGTGSTGTVKTKNCYINAAGQTSNAGCGVDDKSASSFGAYYASFITSPPLTYKPHLTSAGTPLNPKYGGIYAMQWTSTGIKMWFFPRDSIPYNMYGNNPDPTLWGMPSASFAGSGCDFTKHFVNHKLVIDTTFCGDWGNAVWASNPVCSKKATTCNEYVANNPSAFTESFWRINYLKVFRER
jgi:hypothetical protein